MRQEGNAFSSLALPAAARLADSTEATYQPAEEQRILL